MADQDSTAVAAGSGTALADRRHSLHVFAGRLTAALDELAGSSTWSLGVTETVETTVELTTAVSRPRALELAVLAHADLLDVAATVDATSTAAWLRSLVRVTAPAATREVTLAGAVTQDAHRSTADALADGRVLVEQAQVIVHAVDAPAGVGDG